MAAQFGGAKYTVGMRSSWVMGYLGHVLILLKVNVQLSSRTASALIRLYKVISTHANYCSYYM